MIKAKIRNGKAYIYYCGVYLFDVPEERLNAVIDTLVDVFTDVDCVMVTVS